MGLVTENIKKTYLSKILYCNLASTLRLKIGHCSEYKQIRKIEEKIKHQIGPLFDIIQISKVGWLLVSNITWNRLPINYMILLHSLPSRRRDETLAHFSGSYPLTQSSLLLTLIVYCTRNIK